MPTKKAPTVFEQDLRTLFEAWAVAARKAASAIEAEDELRRRSGEKGRRRPEVTKLVRRRKVVEYNISIALKCDMRAVGELAMLLLRTRVIFAPDTAKLVYESAVGRIFPELSEYYRETLLAAVLALKWPEP